MEFLTHLVTTVPDGTPDATVDETRSREAIRAAELAAEGHLLKLWSPRRRRVSGEVLAFGARKMKTS
jgi:muconolactone delta-isomerase